MGRLLRLLRRARERVVIRVEGVVRLLLSLLLLFFFFMFWVKTSLSLGELGVFYAMSSLGKTISGGDIPNATSLPSAFSPHLLFLHRHDLPPPYFSFLF